MKPSVAAMQDIAQTVLNLRRQIGMTVVGKDIHLAVLVARSAVEIACDCDIATEDAADLEEALGRMFR